MLSTLAELAVIFAAAKVAGEIATRLKQPAVVGELLAGVVLGSSVAGVVHVTEPLEVLAQIGVVVLLFLVGLETHPEDLRRVGARAAIVATLGVVLTFGGGLGAGFATGLGARETIFVATAVIATSVTITARVLREAGVISSLAGRLVLGAALIDDILGLLVLAIVAGAARNTLTAGSVLLLTLEAAAFVMVTLLVAPKVVSRVAALFERPRIARAPFAIAMALMLGLSAAANTIGLAAVVGAFLAGTALAETDERYALRAQAEPIGDFLSPFFFVLTGARVDVSSLAHGRVLVLTGAITLVAVAGKSAAAFLGCRGLGRRDRRIVAAGMIPRGEIGIIVAALALGEHIIGTSVFSAVIAMVLATTFATPFALNRALASREPPPARPLV